MPSVSIVMPAYNAAKTIRESIASVIAQTYEDWELIVIDDCSTDNTPELVRNIAANDSRIRLLINEHNLGAASTRNIGIIEAQSDRIAFLDSDDLWHKDKLEKHLQFITETGAEISYTGTAYINEAGQISKYTLPAKREFTYKDLLRRNIMSCSSVIVRRDIMIATPFAQGFIHEDYVVWMQILQDVGQAYGLNEPLLIYRMTDGSKSAARMRSAKMTYGSYRQVGYGKFSALFMTIRYSLHSISKRFFIYLGRTRCKGKTKKKSLLVPTIKSYVYTRILPKLKPKPPIQVSIPVDKQGQLPILAVCDPMTWKNLCQEHAVISLSPRNWQSFFATLDQKKIKFFFCESTWSGITSSCWRGQVYKDRRVLYENRRDLLGILDMCKAKNIPTVFWAKEDPAYFQDEIYDFTDTALQFDYILTTAEECIPKYHSLGYKNVFLWPFGFSPEVYYPPKQNIHREKVAVFAGSWLTDHPHRCKDLASIFDMVLDAEIPLRIYDRYRLSGRSSKPFPAKYQYYVKDAVKYESLGDIYRTVEYVINVNTVKDSGTMFSRRIYEAMACGCIIITNESVGLRRQFNQNLWYLGESFDFSNAEHIRQQNIKTVYSLHTWKQRMTMLCKLIENKGSESDE